MSSGVDERAALHPQCAARRNIAKGQLRVYRIPAATFFLRALAKRKKRNRSGVVARSASSSKRVFELDSVPRRAAQSSVLAVDIQASHATASAPFALPSESQTTTTTTTTSTIISTSTTAALAKEPVVAGLHSAAFSGCKSATAAYAARTAARALRPRTQVKKSNAAAATATAAVSSGAVRAGVQAAFSPVVAADPPTPAVAVPVSKAETFPAAHAGAAARSARTTCKSSFLGGGYCCQLRGTLLKPESLLHSQLRCSQSSYLPRLQLTHGNQRQQSKELQQRQQNQPPVQQRCTAVATATGRTACLVVMDDSARARFSANVVASSMHATESIEATSTHAHAATARECAAETTTEASDAALSTAKARRVKCERAATTSSANAETVKANEATSAVPAPPKSVQRNVRCTNGRKIPGLMWSRSGSSDSTDTGCSNDTSRYSSNVSRSSSICHFPQDAVAHSLKPSFAGRRPFSTELYCGWVSASTNTHDNVMIAPSLKTAAEETTHAASPAPQSTEKGVTDTQLTTGAVLQRNENFYTGATEQSCAEAATTERRLRAQADTDEEERARPQTGLNASSTERVRNSTEAAPHVHLSVIAAETIAAEDALTEHTDSTARTQAVHPSSETRIGRDPFERAHGEGESKVRQQFSVALEKKPALENKREAVVDPAQASTTVEEPTAAAADSVDVPQTFFVSANISQSVPKKMAARTHAIRARTSLSAGAAASAAPLQTGRAALSQRQGRTFSAASLTTAAGSALEEKSSETTSQRNLISSSFARASTAPLHQQKLIRRLRKCDSETWNGTPALELYKPKSRVNSPPLPSTSAGNVVTTTPDAAMERMPENLSLIGAQRVSDSAALIAAVESSRTPAHLPERAAHSAAPLQLSGSDSVSVFGVSSVECSSPEETSNKSATASSVAAGCSRVKSVSPPAAAYDSSARFSSLSFAAAPENQKSVAAAPCEAASPPKSSLSPSTPAEAACSLSAASPLCSSSSLASSAAPAAASSVPVVNLSRPASSWAASSAPASSSSSEASSVASPPSPSENSDAAAASSLFVSANQSIAAEPETPSPTPAAPSAAAAAAALSLPFGFLAAPDKALSADSLSSSPTQSSDASISTARVLSTAESAAARSHTAAAEIASAISSASTSACKSSAEAAVETQLHAVSAVYKVEPKPTPHPSSSQQALSTTATASDSASRALPPSPFERALSSAAASSAAASAAPSGPFQQEKQLQQQQDSSSSLGESKVSAVCLKLAQRSSRGSSTVGSSTGTTDNNSSGRSTSSAVLLQRELLESSGAASPFQSMSTRGASPHMPRKKSGKLQASVLSGGAGGSTPSTPQGVKKVGGLFTAAGSLLPQKPPRSSTSEKTHVTNSAPFFESLSLNRRCPSADFCRRMRDLRQAAAEATAAAAHAHFSFVETNEAETRSTATAAAFRGASSSRKEAGRGRERRKRSQQMLQQRRTPAQSILCGQARCGAHAVGGMLDASAAAVAASTAGDAMRDEDFLQQRTLTAPTASSSTNAAKKGQNLALRKAAATGSGAAAAQEQNFALTRRKKRASSLAGSSRMSAATNAPPTHVQMSTHHSSHVYSPSTAASHQQPHFGRESKLLTEQPRQRQEVQPWTVANKSPLQKPASFVTAARKKAASVSRNASRRPASLYSNTAFCPLHKQQQNSDPQIQQQLLQPDLLQSSPSSSGCQVLTEQQLSLNGPFSLVLQQQPTTPLTESPAPESRSMSFRKGSKSYDLLTNERKRTAPSSAIGLRGVQQVQRLQRAQQERRRRQHTVNSLQQMYCPQRVADPHVLQHQALQQRELQMLSLQQQYLQQRYPQRPLQEHRRKSGAFSLRVNEAGAHDRGYSAANATTLLWPNEEEEGLESSPAPACVDAAAEPRSVHAAIAASHRRSTRQHPASAQRLSSEKARPKRNSGINSSAYAHANQAPAKLSEEARKWVEEGLAVKREQLAMQRKEEARMLCEYQLRMQIARQSAPASSLSRVVLTNGGGRALISGKGESASAMEFLPPERKCFLSTNKATPVADAWAAASVGGGETLEAEEAALERTLSAVGQDRVPEMYSRDFGAAAAVTGEGADDAAQAAEPLLQREKRMNVSVAPNGPTERPLTATDKGEKQRHEEFYKQRASSHVCLADVRVRSAGSLPQLKNEEENKLRQSAAVAALPSDEANARRLVTRLSASAVLEAPSALSSCLSSPHSDDLFVREKMKDETGYQPAAPSPLSAWDCHSSSSSSEHSNEEDSSSSSSDEGVRTQPKKAGQASSSNSGAKRRETNVTSTMRMLEEKHQDDGAAAAAVKVRELPAAILVRPSDHGIHDAWDQTEAEPCAVTEANELPTFTKTGQRQSAQRHFQQNVQQQSTKSTKASEKTEHTHQKKYPDTETQMTRSKAPVIESVPAANVMSAAERTKGSVERRAEQKSSREGRQAGDKTPRANHYTQQKRVSFDSSTQNMRGGHVLSVPL